MNVECDSDYKGLLAKKVELQARIDVARKRHITDLLGEIVRQMVANEISLDDVGMALCEERISRRKAGAKRPAKFMDPRSGKTWSGVGRKPLWLRGKNLDGYRFPVCIELT
ncbi:H-NS histone family protein [Burkholderia stagnalis]|uniref:H-NS histone family protein n=1 Tax=Burkholderia stagnalis TaxID=1503054 RepID=UPI000F5686B8|nr:H-NS histone family protein [Burkholderia stagnalis]RQQ21734.1 H-NS histone family protein [Burkholderia stagnalis]RQQ23577.1 H-NS histone family protein [Burkholderia stagnalis]RQQ41740.1 H-NS histone family protein [Burkholderia stagnalis]RQY04852.1 H-NS histone family protein [Burkholderia stagnalis]RQY45981.1 H-NS histone family protein [Burkholderia stagnalis]